MKWLPRGFLWHGLTDLACRVVGVSRSGFYDWVGREPSARDRHDTRLLELVKWSHERSRGTYGAPRVHADLTMERGVCCGKKRVARIMRHAGIRGVCHQRKRRGWKPLPAPHDDLVKRQFSAATPNRVWFCDITQHRARDGWVYCAAVIDAHSRLVVGWSIGDHLRSELVVDALEMARWQRKPAPGTIVHSDRGAQGEFKWSSQRFGCVVIVSVRRVLQRAFSRQVFSVAFG